MHTGVSSSWVLWQVCCERYTRVLMEASPEFPIHFLKIYSWEIGVGLEWRFLRLTLLPPTARALAVAARAAGDRASGDA